jgi:hypothetical protein
MRRRAIPVVLLSVMAIVLAYGASISLHNRATFGTFSTDGPPPRVDYCGRRYYPGTATRTLGEIESMLSMNRLSGLTLIDTAPSGMPIVANVMTPAQKAQYDISICTMEVWVQTGADAYLPYGLSGGP